MLSPFFGFCSSSLSYGKPNVVNNFKGRKKKEHLLANESGQGTRISEQTTPNDDYSKLPWY